MQTITPIRINGQDRETSGGTLTAVLREMGFDPSRHGIAVARNGAVVPRQRWPETRIAEGDELDVIGAMQGG